MRKLAFALLSFTLMSCASTNHAGVTASTSNNTKRMPSSNDLKIDLQDVAALLKGYFSMPGPKKNEPKIQGYSAYVVQAAEDAEFGRLVIYVDDETDPMGKQKLVVDNSKFLYTGGPLAGDEPSLATNRKDSLLIQTGNDGGGRTAWHETITVAWRNNQLVVAGYDSSDYDRFGEDPDHSCSVNYLTGKGVQTTFPAREANPNGKPKVKNFSFKVSPVLINDWTDASKPKECTGQ